MNGIGDSLRKSVSLGIALLVLTLSVAIPILERAEVSTETVAESEHDPATCPSGHDHLVCTQIAASVSAPSERATPRLAFGILRIASTTWATTVASTTFREGHPSRAPPLA